MNDDDNTGSRSAEPSPSKKGGPRTRRGKEISKMNSLQHGLYAKEVVLRKGPNKEDPQVLDQLLFGLTEQYKPEGPLEHFSVQRIAVAMWKLIRVLKVETRYVLRKMKEAGIHKPIMVFPHESDDYPADLFTAERELETLKRMKEGTKVMGPPTPVYWEFVAAYVGLKLGLDTQENFKELPDVEAKKKFMKDHLGLEGRQVIDAAIVGCEDKISWLEAEIEEKLEEERAHQKELDETVEYSLLLADDRDDWINKRRNSLQREMMKAFEDLLKLQAVRLTKAYGHLRPVRLVEPDESTDVSSNDGSEQEEGTRSDIETRQQSLYVPGARTLREKLMPRRQSQA